MGDVVELKTKKPLIICDKTITQHCEEMLEYNNHLKTELENSKELTDIIYKEFADIRNKNRKLKYSLEKMSLWDRIFTWPY